MLLNFPEVQPFLNDFVSQFGHGAVYSTFEAWFKECVNNPNNGVNNFLQDISWGPAPTITTMFKYCMNGYKFYTEECSKYKKKSNNSGVCVKGGEGNQDGENDYYGVIKEILELSYSGWPYKKIILFRCKWFDPTPRRGTNVHSQYNIIEVNKNREYDRYDPFIIAERVRQVYYAPYLLRRDKADWLVVIKTKPVGRVEVENVLDVAYQNDTSSVN